MGKGKNLKWIGTSLIVIAAILASAFYSFQDSNSPKANLIQKFMATEKNKNIKLNKKQEITKDIKNIGLHNYSALVVKGDKEWIELSKGNKPDSSYLINSVQKAMTAGMIASEAQRGKLNLSDKISKWYPNMAGSNVVTVRNLLTMTSGLESFEKNLERKPYTNDHADLKKDIANTYLIDTKLNKWVYNSLNYIYLSGILEKVDNESYEQIFNKTYVQPLELKHTDFYWNRTNFKSKQMLLKNGFVFSKANNLYMPMNPNQIVLSAHHMMGAGSIVMSNKDLAKTIRYILSSQFLNNRSHVDLYKTKKAGTYNGGFYNYKNYKSANGTANGYETFLRITNDGKNILIIQSNTVRKGTFKDIKCKVNKIWNTLNNYKVRDKNRC